jgi:hypothetical protein
MHAVRRSLDKKRQRRGDVGGLEDNGMQLDAVAHRNHDLRALVVVEEVADGIASTPVDGV